jgi:hypothetical protein
MASHRVKYFCILVINYLWFASSGSRKVIVWPNEWKGCERKRLWSNFSHFLEFSWVGSEEIKILRSLMCSMSVHYIIQKH